MKIVMSKHFRTVIESIAVLGLIVQILLIAGLWNIIPDVVPIHFDFTGNVDATGKKSDILVLLFLTFGLYAGLSWLSTKTEHFNLPWKVREEDSEVQHTLARTFVSVLKAESVWILTLIVLQVVGVSLSLITKLNQVFIVGVVLITAATILVYFVVASRLSDA